MEQIKISLSDAAQNQGCSIDYLMAMAEAERIDIFARIGPLSALLRNIHGELMPTIDRQGNPAPRMGLHTRGGMSYTTLLPLEIALLRSGNKVTIRVLREEGSENGINFPSLNDENYLFHLTEPQTIGIEQLFINEQVQAANTSTNVNKLKNRSSILNAEIKMAIDQALDKTDYKSVWAKLFELAEKNTGCMCGTAEGEIKYMDSGKVKFFKLRNINERMARR